MTARYGRSTDGSDSDDGLSWANAKATTGGASGIAAGDSAGDDVYLSSAHAESTASSTNAWAGTNTNPTRVMSVSDAAEPPTALAAGAGVTVTGTTFAWTGGCYAYGVTFTFSSSSTWTPRFNSTSGFAQTYEDCSFFYTGNSAGATIAFGSTGAGEHGLTELLNPKFKLGHSGQRVAFSRDAVIRGGSWESGGVSPVGAFVVGNGSRSCRLMVDGFDFTNLGSSANLIQSIAEGGCDVQFRNCKPPASWTGDFVASGQIKYGSRCTFYNVHNDNHNAFLKVVDYNGTIDHDESLYRAPGLPSPSPLYNGSTQLAGISWKMVAANAAYPVARLESIELIAQNTVLDPATSHVITCYFTTPGQADFTPLDNRDIGLLLQYNGNDNLSTTKFARSLKGQLASASDYGSDSSGDWDDNAVAWAASTAVALGAVRRPTTRNGKTYYCSVAGTTSGTEPTWGTTEGGETSDGGTVKWRCMHRQKMVITLDASAGKVKERGPFLPVVQLFTSDIPVWVDPNLSITSS